jgi:hypothetical protein
MSDKLVPFPERRGRKKKCPVCGRPPLAGSEPFCSKRCGAGWVANTAFRPMSLPTKPMARLEMTP